MKKFFFAFLLIAGTMFSVDKASAQNGAGISYQTFYNDLSPYGRWIDYPGYGYVWCPNEGSSFTPYGTNGYWDYTDEGWAWVSNYSWGWAPFHYGRWFYDDFYGWTWVPGYEWAPAWVTWRQSNDYFGWAPLGVGIDISIGYNPPARYWNFVPQRYITDRQINRHYINHNNNTTIVNNTTVINNTYVINNNRRINGPARDQVEKVTRQKIEPLKIRDAQTPANQNKVQKGELAVYRPHFDNNNNPGNRTAPPKFEKYKGKDAVKPNNVNTTPAVNNGTTTSPVVTPPKRNNNGRPRNDQHNTQQPITNPSVKPQNYPNNPAIVPHRITPSVRQNNNNPKNNNIPPKSQPVTPSNRPALPVINNPKPQQQPRVIHNQHNNIPANRPIQNTNPVNNTPRNIPQHTAPPQQPRTVQQIPIPQPRPVQQAPVQQPRPVQEVRPVSPPQQQPQPQRNDVPVRKKDG